MLRSLHSLEGLTVLATDGKAGHLESVHFDDETWTVRYLVVETGGLIHHDRFLVPPTAVAEVGVDDHGIRLAISRKEVAEGPAYDKHRPISRQVETEIHLYYRLGFYWTHLGDPHLRNSRDLRKAPVHGTDGERGWLDDLLVELDDWRIRHLVLDEGGMLDDRLVLAEPDQVERLGWDEASVHLRLPCAAIEELPRYDSAAEAGTVTLDGEPHRVDMWGRSRPMSRR